MFCGNCGSKIPDDSAFCPKCSSPIQRITPPVTPSAGQSIPAQPSAEQPAANPAQQQGSYQQPNPYQQQNQFRQEGQYQQANQYQQAGSYQQANQYQQPGQQYQPGGFGYSAEAEKTSRKKKFILLGVVAAAAVVVIILLVTLLGGGSTKSPEGTIKKLEKSINDLNISDMLECFDTDIQDEYAYLDYNLGGIADLAGVSYSCEMTVLDTDYYSSGSEEYCDVYVNVSLSYSYLGYSDSDEDSDSITMVKRGGEWLIDEEAILNNLF